ncbi:lipoprotein 17-related variable surface protein [[Mycoplasma] phocidae]|uniref:lipoprotein 17-related variable surface protein n=1 Tax=[Mycoplasma] phocae TaxID=142651 RepID=UPI0014764F26|nr:lipoprotein 17-related variable surface protein [[Mycoplasma] phocae]
MPTPGSIASVITLPLVAAACNNTKPEPKPNTDQEAVNKSLDNIKVEVADKNKLPKEVKKTDITISDQVSGFTYSVESLSPNDKTGELTVKVKSTKGSLGATKDFKIDNFKKETKNDDKKNDLDKNKLDLKKELKEFKDNAKFNYSMNVINPFNAFALKLTYKPGYIHEVIDAKSKTNVAGEIQYHIVKISIKKETTKLFDVYIKLNANGSTFVDEKEFIRITEEKKANELKTKTIIATKDFKSKAEYKYNGKLDDTDANLFKQTNVILTKNDGYKSTFEVSKVDLIGKAVIAKFNIVSITDVNVKFSVYVKFNYTTSANKAEFVEKNFFEQLPTKEEQDKFKNAEFTYNGNLNEFNLNMIDISNKSFKINRIEKIDDPSQQILLVKIFATKDDKEFITYLKFLKNSNNKNTGLKISQLEFEQLVEKLLP